MRSMTSLHSVMHQTRMTSYDAAMKRLKTGMSRTCRDSDKVMKPSQIRMEMIYEKMTILKISLLPGEILPCPEYQKLMKGRK